jgi:uncharacterized protein YndB with AHSA1/START domain
MPVDPARLWAALTDPDQASNWLGGRMEWELREGSPLVFVDDDGSLRRGRLDVVRTGRYLRYLWWDEAGDTSEVSYLLEPEGEGTRLTIQERSVMPGGAPAGRLLSAPGVQATPGGGQAVVTWSRWDGVLAALWAAVATITTCRVLAGR